VGQPSTKLNEPAITVINFGRSGDTARIQAILDEAG